MRVAHVSDFYRPRLGGIEVQVHDLALQQIRAGHLVEVLTSTAGGAGGSDEEVPVHRLGRSAADLPSPSGLAQLRRILVRGDVDVVHAHVSVVSPLAWSAVRIAARAGLPVVVSMHSVLRPRARLLRPLAELGGWTRWPIVWTAVSSVAAAPLQAVVGEPVGILHNGIDVGAWRPSGPRPPAPELTIASVMRLTQRKRPLPLVRILNGIRRELPPEIPLRAVIVGDGPLRGPLLRALGRASMDSWVRLTGAVDRPRVRSILAGSDVYLAPARRESFGIAALEARCAGLPVVAMATGGVGEFLRQGRDGFLARSDADMIHLTARLLGSQELRLMQERNRLSAPDLSWPQVVDRTLGAYRLAAQKVGVPAGRGALVGVT